MEILIVTTDTKRYEEYWQHHFDLLFGSFIPREQTVIVVQEDWKGGAGNGLGSLYAYQKARQKALERYGIDLLEEQKNGSSISIYHTAGYGTRLAPLTISEYNNKSAVKIPGLLTDNILFTILDAAIKQTQQFPFITPGRLSIYWGDQVFIPSKSPHYKPSHHVEIFVRCLPMPTEAEWNRDNWDKYGFIALETGNTGKIVDKCNYSTIKNLLNSHKISSPCGIAQSLGSFSLSFPMTQAFLQFFERELEQKNERWDSDPYFWMATTLDKETYCDIMLKKNCPVNIAEKHYQRMQNFKESFCAQNPDHPFFGVMDIGNTGYWWDYGSLDSYFDNNLKLTQNDPEAHVMRKFYNHSLNKDSNCLVNCEIENGTIENSVLIGVKASKIDVKNCLIINSQLNQLTARDCMLYNVQEKESILLDPGTIRADVNLKENQFKMYTRLRGNSSSDWSIRLPNNPLSYEELFLLIRDSDTPLSLMFK